MKLTRAEFKVMIKECLKELITEGALNHAVQQYQPQQMMPMPQMGYGQQQYAPVQVINSQQQQMARVAAQQAAGGDPNSARLFETIFQDTAQNAYQEQMANDPFGDGVNNYGQQQQMAPQQMGYAPQQGQQQQNQQQQGNSRWAQLAFGPATKSAFSAPSSGPLQVGKGLQ